MRKRQLTPLGSDVLLFLFIAAWIVVPLLLFVFGVIGGNETG